MSFRKVQIGNVETSATHFSDPIITLNYDETGTNTSDVGIVLERGSLSNVALLWDESEDQFVAITTTHDGGTDGNVTISSYADFKASTFIGNLTGNVTGDVTGTVSSISNHDTDSLSEGSSNLYYTGARFDTRLATKTTDNLTEGSNQYYTNARARASLSATGSISYNNSTGVISYTAPTALSSFTNDSGFITSYTVTESDVTAHQAALSITESQISDFGSYLNDTGDNTITDTTASSSAGPVVNLYRNNASPSNANYLGQIKFQGKSSTGTTRTYAKITGKIADVTNGSEDGTIEFSVLDTGSNAIPVRINENGLYLNAGYTLKFEGPVANTNELTLTTASLNADRTLTFPDATGTVAITSDIPGDTDSLSEGSSNLYFTNARADARISAATTDDLSEGSSNLYFTNARADARITNAFAGAVSLGSTLNVTGNTTLNGTLTLPDADISFQDNNGTFPTSGKGFYWDLNNDEARIYAIQSASDYIDLVFKVSDNTNNQNDRWVFWLDGYQGQSSDAFPLTMTADNFYVFSDPSSTDGKPDLGTSSYKMHIPSGKTSTSTTNHKGRLHLQGDNTGDLYVRYENDTNVNAYVFQDQSDSNNLKLETHNDLCFNTNGANERMVINSAGRVGIGTDPYSDANLHVKNGSVGLEFSLDGAVSSEARILSYDRTANARRGLVLDGDHLDFRTGGSTRFLVNSNGSMTVSGNILPDANTTYDIGSSTMRFNDIYLAGNTVDIGGTKLSKDSNGDLDIKDSSDVRKTIKAAAIELFDTDGKKIKIERDASSGKMKTRKFDSSGNAEANDDDVLNLEEDKSPKLGGNLDIANFNITGTGNITTTGDATITGKLAVDQNHTSNAVIRGDGLNGAFQHGRYGHTLIQNKNHSTSNYWGLSPRDGGNMEISYGAPNSYGSLTSGAVMAFTTDGHVGIGTTSPADANWSHSTYGNTEVAIDGDGGYAVLHLRGDGAGSTDTRYSMGVGDGKFYMAYDDVNNTHRICVESNGNVGIGNTGAAAKLHVSGDIYATGDVTAYYSSDINLKENVVDIENALDKVKQIRGVHYDWKDEYIEKHSYVEKEDVGVIAQEVEKVLPEIVTDREDGTKAVKYDRLTALLIEAVKELSAKVDAQQEEINILKGK